jgi:hypothetical protein
LNEKERKLEVKSVEKRSQNEAKKSDKNAREWSNYAAPSDGCLGELPVVGSRFSVAGSRLQIVALVRGKRSISYDRRLTNYTSANQEPPTDNRQLPTDLAVA